MSELQAEVPIEEVTEPVETGSELATDSPVEGEQNTDNVVIDGVEVDGPEGVKKAINKQHFKFREEQRRANDLQKQLDALNASKPAESISEIPPIPDSWDDNFEQKIRDRDKVITRVAQAEANKKNAADRQVDTKNETERQQLQRSQELQNGFSDNAKKLGVEQDILLKAQETVVGYGVSPELATALLNDSEGPLMVQYLAANPLDLHDIVNAAPMEAGLMLAGIKVKAAVLKPKTTSAPDPATTLNGRGVPAQQRGPKGATFE